MQPKAAFSAKPHKLVLWKMIVYLSSRQPHWIQQSALSTETAPSVCVEGESITFHDYNDFTIDIWISDPQALAADVHYSLFNCISVNHVRMSQLIGKGARNIFHLFRSNASVPKNKRRNCSVLSFSGSTNNLIIQSF